ncbi:MAG: HAD hydrolase family protein, partial [Clostridia bacterium]|nr:HAD hydrolase family protein [Clostridia bacterium]
IQVGNIKASKYNGVESIRNRLGINTNEIAVFGDDINDLEMLSGYENSVAMGNAIDVIKSAARFVTKTNDNDGIAFAIENILNV